MSCYHCATMPKDVKRIPFDVRVSITGQNGKEYAGVFSWYRRTIGDIPLIAAETSRLMNGQPVNGSSMSNVVQMMAELLVVTEKGPAWWNLDTLFDEKVLVGVYAQYVEWRDAFFRDEADTAVPATDAAAGTLPQAGGNTARAGSSGQA